MDNGGTNDDSMEGSEKSEKRKLLESWLNKIMKIKISDGRTLIGSFLCTDQDRNIILGSCQEFVGSSEADAEIDLEYNVLAYQKNYNYYYCAWN
ncbi:N-alpha-acetyltransferase 38, NatC auxiliary subunit-like isoform X2 [Acropora millepora]|uniref:N-alpha-acetyltransferase 38, NatC auxiliary subunit-like isoform X2 n=1 Tax=Acropora millepora TaxID=45264 RepID=UPI0010FC858E|nr:N-alpha-acetyltransferase 38, NatC auxiliary subunit-like isoform X2 [Acropora millepora]